MGPVYSAPPGVATGTPGTTPGEPAAFEAQVGSVSGVVARPTVAEFNPQPPVVFRADHPFVYLIRDTSTNAVLFLGRVTDPSQT
jgi:serine protease inhibitor